MIYIKLKGMKHTISCEQTVYPYIHPSVPEAGQNVNYFPFLKVVVLHIKLTVTKQRITLHFYTLDEVRAKGKSFLKMVVLHIKLIRNMQENV